MGRKQRIAIIALSGVVLSAPIATVHASVVMPNTRVIYNGAAQEQSVQFTNEDTGPSVMQVWTDSGNEKSTPKTADGPFLVNPPIFRIEPKAGQTVRIVFTGKDLPQDRESVFYLNTLQIPSLGGAFQDQNQMLVILRNRVKLFYRPAGIAGSPQKAAEKLEFRLASDGGSLRVAASNGSDYYISLIRGQLVCASQTATFSPDMIAPRSGAQWAVKGGCAAGAAPVRVKVQYVDDYGAVRELTAPVATTTAK
jgi:fimbrial chaperone protein